MTKVNRPLSVTCLTDILARMSRARSRYPARAGPSLAEIPESCPATAESSPGMARLRSLSLTTASAMGRWDMEDGSFSSFMPSRPK